MTKRIDPTMNKNQALSEATWPADKVAEFKRLYVEEGLTCSEIGRRMGISKNAAVGKRVRLGLVRGVGFVPSVQQMGRLKQEALRGPWETIYTRLDALHAKLDDILAAPRPAGIVPARMTDNAERPFERRRGA